VKNNLTNKQTNRRLSDDELGFLLCVALRCKRHELGMAAMRDKDAARLREFDKWFGTLVCSFVLFWCCLGGRCHVCLLVALSVSRSI
jgi:hypothetical protein